MTEPPLFVLFVCPFPDLEGGGQRSLLLLLKHLDRSRCRPLVLTPGEGEMSRLSRELRVPVIVEKYPRLKSARVWESLFFILRLARLLRRCGPAIVHGDRPDLGLLCALAARLSGAGSVFHARVGERHRLDPLLGLLNDAVVCVSQASAERFGPGAVVVRNGADLDAFKPRGKASAKASIGIPPASPVLGFAGRLSREKGLETALRSFALVLREMPNARLVVLGRGPWGKKVPELAGELGMSGSLLFPGFTQTPELFFPALDLLLFPTQEVEGLPRVLVEAMACGVPALAESIGLRPPRARPSLRLPAAALGRARDFLLSSGLRPSDRLLFLHPGGRYPAQRWPADRLARSAARTGAGIVVSAGPRESREMSAMKALLPEAVFLEGADALELASCLALCGAFAGNNSGPLHLACALGVPSLSTSGPTDRSRFDPMGEDCLVLDAADFGPGREIGQIPEEAFAEALSPIVARAKTLEERFRLAGGG